MSRLGAALSFAPIEIGLLNIMSGRALNLSERLFTGLLHQALPGAPFRLRFFASEEAVRTEQPVSWTGTAYEPVSALLDGASFPPVHAMVVTGKGPQAPDLRAEPAWPDLARLAEWAEEHGVPVMWSCLAAHAAVLHLSGIRTRRLPRKLTGLFPCERGPNGTLTLPGLPPSWSTPHSRYNGLPEAELVANGYEILSRSEAAGVDTFIRQGSALSLFCQGHPEYERDTLLIEYRRDARSFLAGASDQYPDIPADYFDPKTESELAQLRADLSRRADSSGSARLDAVLNAGARTLRASWRASAAQLCASWLTQALPRGDQARPATHRTEALVE
jgi:homoserine O-succinyltransferase